MINARSLANVLLKVIGIYWFVQAIVLLIQGVMMPFMDLQNVIGFNWKFETASILLYFAVYATVSYFLIFRTHSILRLIAIDEEQENSIDFKSHPFGQLAFSLMGTFVSISALGHILSILMKLVSQLMATGEYVRMFKQALLQNYLPGLAENIAKLIIGTALILGREKLGRLWRRMRPLAENDDESGKE